MKYNTPFKIYWHKIILDSIFLLHFYYLKFSKSGVISLTTSLLKFSIDRILTFTRARVGQFTTLEFVTKANEHFRVLLKGTQTDTVGEVCSFYPDCPPQLQTSVASVCLSLSSKCPSHSEDGFKPTSSFPRTTPEQAGKSWGRAAWSPVYLINKWMLLKRGLAVSQLSAMWGMLLSVWRRSWIWEKTFPAICGKHTRCSFFFFFSEQLFCWILTENVRAVYEHKVKS